MYVGSFYGAAGAAGAGAALAGAGAIEAGLIGAGATVGAVLTAPVVIAGSAVVGAYVYRKEILAAGTGLVTTAIGAYNQATGASTAATTAVTQAAKDSSYTGAGGSFGEPTVVRVPTFEELAAAAAAAEAARAAASVSAAATAAAAAATVTASVAAAATAANTIAATATATVSTIPVPTTVIVPVPPPVIEGAKRRIPDVMLTEISDDVRAIWSKPARALRFPSKLGSGTPGRIFPFVQFTAKAGSRKDIFLPIPMGLTFSDNMQYSTLDLGIIGSAVSKATTAAVNEGGFMSGAGGALGAAGRTFLNQMKSVNGAAIASLAARQTGFDNVSNFIDFGAKQVVAPNTNTAFQNSGVRQFQFSFKMMPTDQKEAEEISEIVKRFRQNMYPIANDLILTYPPIWSIKFFDGSESSENKKLPGLYDCYLIGMSAVYNGSGNMFHADGHPVETEVQLTFEETRALTLADISKLSENRA